MSVQPVRRTLGIALVANIQLEPIQYLAWIQQADELGLDFLNNPPKEQVPGNAIVEKLFRRSKLNEASN